MILLPSIFLNLDLKQHRKENNMITEDYVGFETAKLLKEKGFDYYPDGSYWLIDANNVRYWVSETGAYDYVDNPTESFQRPKNGHRLVTLQMAMKWLREMHAIIVVIFPIRTVKSELAYNTSIYNTHAEHKKLMNKDYQSYEQACEAAIKYCLTELI